MKVDFIMKFNHLLVKYQNKFVFKTNNNKNIYQLKI